MTIVGQYVRDLGASTARLVENALDWEHLPYVHSGSFKAISVVSSDDNGWVASASLASGIDGLITLTLDDDRLGWVTQTLHQDRILGRIESRVETTGRDTCKVSVVFKVPDINEDQRGAVGAYYESLYAQLYDEDEKLMIARAKAIADGPTAYAARRQVSLADGSSVSVPLVCPHQGLPLTDEPDADGVITCPWHGYRFDATSGRCLSGQIAGWADTPALPAKP
jgi:nitrite reductase/ring-hydroxylating ferredoxin subunit